MIFNGAGSMVAGSRGAAGWVVCPDVVHGWLGFAWVCATWRSTSAGPFSYSSPSPRPSA